jgi:lysophospholipase L1-like esterase
MTGILGVLLGAGGASGSPAFPVTSGQNLLVRAQDIAQSDTSNVATWTDTSGSGNNLTASGGSQPQLALSGGNDALPFVWFTSNAPNDNEGLSASSAYPVDQRACSIFAVLDYNSIIGAQYTITLGGGTNLVFMMDGATGHWRMFNGGFTNFSQGLPPTGRRIAILITFGASAVKFYLDSSANVSSIAAEAAASVSGFQLSGAGLLQAKVYEARGFSRELSSGEAAQILDTWAPAVYGTGAAASTPSGRVIFDGDSLSQGIGATKGRNYPYYVNPANGWVGHDYGISGQTWANLISRQSVVNAYANATNYLMVNCGSNDVSNGRTTVQMETDFQTYTTAAVTAGFSKSNIVINTLSVQNLGASGTARNDFNTWLRANYTTYAGFLFDLQQDADLGSSLAGAPTVSGNWYDGVHYTDHGYTLYASKIRALIGSPPF